MKSLVSFLATPFFLHPALCDPCRCSGDSTAVCPPMSNLYTLKGLGCTATVYTASVYTCKQIHDLKNLSIVQIIPHRNIKAQCPCLCRSGIDIHGCSCPPPPAFPKPSYTHFRFTTASRTAPSTRPSAYSTYSGWATAGKTVAGLGGTGLTVAIAFVLIRRFCGAKVQSVYSTRRLALQRFIEARRGAGVTVSSASTQTSPARSPFRLSSPSLSSSTSSQPLPVVRSRRPSPSSSESDEDVEEGLLDAAELQRRFDYIDREAVKKFVSRWGFDALRDYCRKHYNFAYEGQTKEQIVAFTLEAIAIDSD